MMCFNMRVNMQKITNTKIFKSILALVLIILVFTVSSQGKTTIDKSGLLLSQKYEREIAYTFKIKNKLIGTGNIKVLVARNKIRGIARGLGKTKLCNVDFKTRLTGIYDNHNDKISVLVHGKGDPLRIFSPGKVSFYGPLKGKLKGNKLKLKGKVTINGIASNFAGFDKTEELQIEISDKTLAREINEIRQRLASL